MKHRTQIKDLRHFVGRAEAQLTALKIGIDDCPASSQGMKDKAHELSQRICELRRLIENLAN